MKTIKDGVQAVSGRACCGGNGDLCSCEETASNVIALCQSSYCTVTTEQHIRTQASFISKNGAQRDRKTRFISRGQQKENESGKLKKREKGFMFPR